MTQYNFQGDLDNISDRQLQFLNSVILDLGYVNSRISLENVGKPGDNYVANVKRIKIDGTNRSLRIIAKLAPTVESVRQAMNTTMMFKNELIMYNEVLPKFAQLQKDANISDKGLLRYAKCYGSLSEQPDEVLLLEDLNVTEYVMLDRISPLSCDCIKSALENLAVLHSLSFVLRHRDQEKYSDIKIKLSDDWSAMAEMDYVKTYFQELENDTIAVIEDQKYVDFLRHKLTKTLELAKTFALNDITNKYTVIQHGDTSTNNILFNFEGENLVDSIMIDYQNSRCSSPASDILYLTFNCTDHATRSKHFLKWIDHYHLILEQSLSTYRLKANIIYPKDKLDVDLKQYSNLLFGLSIFLASLMIRKADDAEKIKDAMSNETLGDETQKHLVTSLDEDSKKLFKDKVIGLIDTCIELKLM